ncbi:hypothetical protein [Novosphingobium sp. 18050]|nr:hypothetical protein [Novosphingobium sp. 18050]
MLAANRAGDRSHAGLARTAGALDDAASCGAGKAKRRQKQNGE